MLEKALAHQQLTPAAIFSPSERQGEDGRILIFNLLSQNNTPSTNNEIAWALLSTLWKYPRLLSSTRIYEVLNALMIYVSHFENMDDEYRSFAGKPSGNLEQFKKYYLFLRSIANDAVFSNINISDVRRALQSARESSDTIAELWNKIKEIDPTIVDIISQEADHYYPQDGLGGITQYMLEKILEEMENLLMIRAGSISGSGNSSSALVNSRGKTMREEMEDFSFSNPLSAQSYFSLILQRDTEPGNFEEVYSKKSPEELKTKILEFIQNGLFSQKIFSSNIGSITANGVQGFMDIITIPIDTDPQHSGLIKFVNDISINSLLADKIGLTAGSIDGENKVRYREARALVREILIRSGVTEDFINDYFTRPPAGKESKIKASAPGIPEVAETRSDKVGGIDFDPSKLNLQIKRDGHGVPLPMPQQDIEHIDIKGLFPVILEILPANARTVPILGKIEPANQISS